MHQLRCILDIFSFFTPPPKNTDIYTVYIYIYIIKYVYIYIYRYVYQKSEAFEIVVPAWQDLKSQCFFPSQVVRSSLWSASPWTKAAVATGAAVALKRGRPCSGSWSGRQAPTWDGDGTMEFLLYCNHSYPPVIYRFFLIKIIYSVNGMAIFRLKQIEKP